MGRGPGEGGLRTALTCCLLTDALGTHAIRPPKAEGTSHSQSAVGIPESPRSCLWAPHPGEPREDVCPNLHMGKLRLCFPRGHTKGAEGWKQVLAFPPPRPVPAEVFSSLPPSFGVI